MRGAAAWVAERVGDAAVVELDGVRAPALRPGRAGEEGSLFAVVTEPSEAAAGQRELGVGLQRRGLGGLVGAVPDVALVDEAVSA